jgi:hypothetical protein
MSSYESCGAHSSGCLQVARGHFPPGSVPLLLPEVPVPFPSKHAPPLFQACAPSHPRCASAGRRRPRCVWPRRCYPRARGEKNVRRGAVVQPAPRHHANRRRHHHRCPTVATAPVPPRTFHPVECSPGDLLFFHGWVPHRSSANTCGIPPALALSRYVLPLRAPPCVTIPSLSPPFCSHCHRSSSPRTAAFLLYNPASEGEWYNECAQPTSSRQPSPRHDLHARHPGTSIAWRVRACRSVSFCIARASCLQGYTFVVSHDFDVTFPAFRSQSNPMRRQFRRDALAAAEALASVPGMGQGGVPDAVSEEQVLSLSACGVVWCGAFWFYAKLYFAKQAR